MSFPSLDLPGFMRRSIALAPEYVQHVEDRTPGFVAKQIDLETSWIQARLRKRYGKSWQASGLPFGATPAPLIASGTAPPGILLSGAPTLGSLELVLQVTTPGALGTAVTKWSQDGGVTFVPGLVSSPAAVLGATGILAAFSVGTYGADNVYRAATPVPEVILGWIAKLVSLSVVRKHRIAYSNEKGIELIEEDAKQTRADVEEAANGENGLIDLPVNEDSDSAISSGGPLGYSEPSPYTWTDVQAREVCR